MLHGGGNVSPGRLDNRNHRRIRILGYQRVSDQSHQGQRIVFGGFAPVACLFRVFPGPIEGQCNCLLLTKSFRHRSFERVEVWPGFRQGPVYMCDLVPDCADIGSDVGRSLKRDDPGLTSQPVKKLGAIVLQRHDMRPQCRQFARLALHLMSSQPFKDGKHTDAVSHSCPDKRRNATEVCPHAQSSLPASV